MTPTTPSPISDQAAGELLPCPFCSCKLLPNTNQGDLYVKRYGSHFDHPGGLCFLADAEVSPSEVEAWNRRSTAPTTGSAPESLAFEYAKAEVARKLGMKADAVRVCPISDIECASARECELASGKCRKFAAPASHAASVLPEGWKVKVTPFEVQVRGPDGKGYSGSRTPKSRDGLAGYTLVKLVLALLDPDALLAASTGGDTK